MGRIIAENKHTGKLYPVDSKAIYRVIYEVVAVLPTENIKTSVIYCVPIIGKENEYDMFLYIDSNWVSVGSGSIDLSDYYTKEEVDDIVADISTLSFKIVQEKPVEDIETNIIYLIPKSGSETGNIYEEWIYIDKEWELLGATDIDLSNYMTLAPLNPTAEEIAALPSGQLYGDTTNHKGVIKGGQEFYDTTYVDENYRKTVVSDKYPQSINGFNAGDKWICCARSASRDRTFVFYKPQKYDGRWFPLNNYLETSFYPPPTYERFDNINYIYKRFVGDEYIHESNGTQDFYKLTMVRQNTYGTQYSECYYTWVKIYSSSKIDSMIPTVPTNISAFTNDSGFLTLETLPIYDGTVI